VKFPRTIVKFGKLFSKLFLAGKLTFKSQQVRDIEPALYFEKENLLAFCS